MFRYADLVRTGDEVLVEGKDELTPVKVISISSVKMQGNKKLELKAFHSVLCPSFYTPINVLYNFPVVCT